MIGIIAGVSEHLRGAPQQSRWTGRLCGRLRRPHCHGLHAAAHATRQPRPAALERQCPVAPITPEQVITAGARTAAREFPWRAPAPR